MIRGASMKRLSLICLPLLLAACQQSPHLEPASVSLAAQGKAFAQTACAGCHSIEPYGRSYTSAPSFPVIVNHEGLTEETLSTWLQGAHNYPQEMDFYLQEEAVRALVTYMLTMRDPDFRRPPD
jgi:mono/diheme cytochrome c family protein